MHETWLRRLPLAGAIAAAALLAVSACGVPESKGEGGDALQSTDMGLGADHAFVARGTLADEQGTHVRYDHLYRGVRVFEGDTIVHSTAAGSTTTGNVMADIRISTNAALSARDAVAFAHAALQPRGPYAWQPTAELVVVPQDRDVVKAKLMRGPGGELTATDFDRVADGYKLAYLVQTALENGAAETRHTDFLVDASSGSILKQWEALETAAATGTGNSEYSGSVSLGTNTISGGWELRDVARSMNFATYNLNHGTTGQGTIYSDTDNTWGDGANYTSGGSTTSANGQTAAVDAHYGVAKTADYYLNVLARNGIDGSGTATYSRVHYSSSYDNAFWDDTCFCMTYGDGSSFKVLTAIDVAGHEMSHGVTSRTAGLTYSGESGGLNEAWSDINGTMVEFYARGGGTTTVPATGGNWTIGEQLATNPLRYMYKPSLDGSSPDAWSSSIGSLDVHYSSGPMNRAFYFLSQGSSSTSTSNYYSSYLPGGMTGIGNDHAARIAYKALTTYMNSSTNYAGARTALMSGASALYGSTSAEYAAVQNAFAAINVGAPAGGGGGGGGTVTTLSNGVGLGSQSGATGADAYYKITVPSSQTQLQVVTSGGTGDADLYVKLGSQPSTTTYDYSSTGSTTAETVTVANPAAGDWYITLHAYAAYSGVTIKATYTGGGGGGGSGQLLANPGFESGAVSWSQSSGVIENNSANAHTGSWDAYLDGYGTSHTDYVYQDVTIPSTVTSATLSFWLSINTAETGSTAYDTLKVQIRNTSNTVLATLATYSNVNAGGYSQKSFSVTSYKGQTIRVYFLGVEDASLQTSFHVDDTALNYQ